MTSRPDPRPDPVPTFGQRLRAATQEHGPLCAGIDPHRALVESWGLAYDLDGLRSFTAACVEAFAGHVAVVKPQSAFFEVFGSGGVAVLEGAIRDLRDAGTLVLLDAKRGDIGSTMAAYAEAYLGDAAGAPADALTVSPYLGFESLRPALDTAAAHGRGVFVLALTSNPEGQDVQHARGELSVAESMCWEPPARTLPPGPWRLGAPGSSWEPPSHSVQDLGLDLTVVTAAPRAGVGRRVARRRTSTGLRRRAAQRCCRPAAATCSRPCRRAMLRDRARATATAGGPVT